MIYISSDWVLDWTGELLQRLPSGELNVSGDTIAISTNSNDQVVTYSISDVLDQSMFNAEFGAMEYEFETELLPMELGGLFTWKPNLAINNSYTVIEWNSAAVSLTKRDREISLYNSQGFFVQHFKCEEDPWTPLKVR